MFPKQQNKNRATDASGMRSALPLLAPVALQARVRLQRYGH